MKYLCVLLWAKLNDPDRLRHSVHEFYVKSPAQMSELFADIPEAIENTQEIANKCNLELNLGNPTPPNFKFTREYAKEYNISLPKRVKNLVLIMMMWFLMSFAKKDLRKG